MYSRNIDRGRISLGLAFHSMRPPINTEDVSSGLKREENQIAFMKLRVKTSAGSIDAIAAMRGSYGSFLVSELKDVVGGKWMEAEKGVKRATLMFGSSTMRSSKRICFPKSMRDYAGMPENGGVYVVERNGYAVISPNEAIGEIESVPFDGLATTIDFLVAGIVKEGKREAAAIYQ